MTKRGQVTIFLLVAILLVAAMVVLFLTKDKLSIKGAETTPEEFAPITEYIESCLARSLEDAVRLVGLQGGHINLPENHVEAGLFKAAYGVENNKNAIPSKKAIESEISRYVELTAPFCFDRSELRQYDLSLGDAKAEVSISDKSVGADLRMPLTITQEEGAILHDKTYSVNIESPLGETLDFSEKITKEIIKNPASLNINLLSQSGFFVRVLTQEEKEIYVITRTIKRGEEVYVFMFAT